ncbi:MAG TPA: HD domain-containing protein [Anaerolineae bacterium]|nr:HD domain-containing protein [Anaerolineae bacterium]
MLTLEQARAWYPAYDPVHGFDHIERVYHLCEIIGKAEDANMEIVLTAALLHDSQGSSPKSSMRYDHNLHSAEFAGQVLEELGWLPECTQAVQHCIRAHRFRHNSEKPSTLEAKVLFDADKLDVIGAIGIARTIAYAIQAQEPYYTQPSRQFQKTGKTQAGECHSVYHEYLYKLRNVKEKLYTSTGKRLAEGRHEFLKLFFSQLVGEMRGER